MRRIAVLAPVALALAGTAAAANHERLAAAFLRGDREALTGAAQRAGNRALADAMAGADPVRARAAIAAAPSAPEAWQLLEPLAALARASDRSRAAPAARAAARIARRLDPLAVSRGEVAGDALADRLAAWRDVAELAGLWPDVRVHALDTASSIYQALGQRGDTPFQLAPMLADPEPELRRAALELLPVPVPAALRAPVAERVTGDPDDDVALGAAQALCRELGLDASAGPALAALGASGLARVGELVTDPAAPLGAVADAARCLAADGGAASRAALSALARRGPEPLRDAIRALIEARR